MQNRAKRASPRLDSSHLNPVFDAERYVTLCKEILREQKCDSEFFNDSQLHIRLIRAVAYGDRLVLSEAEINRIEFTHSRLRKISNPKYTRRQPLAQYRSLEQRVSGCLDEPSMQHQKERKAAINAVLFLSKMLKKAVW